MSDVDARPRWARDLARFLPLKSQFVLTGNVRDLQIRVSGTTATAASLPDVLVLTLTEAGYDAVVRYDPVSGFAVLARPDGSEPDAASVFGRLGLAASGGSAPAGVELFGATLERLVRLDGPPVALVADFASRLVVRGDALSPQEQQLFTRALVLGQSAKARPVGPNRAPRFNPVIWIADREGDLPDWLTIDNPQLRHIPVAPPERAARRAVAPSLVRGLPGARDAGPDAVRAAEDTFVDATEGMLLVDLNSIAQLARAEGVGVLDVGEAVRRYKVGVTEDAWQKIERDRIRDGADFVTRRVIGQDHAVVHMLDIVKRAATGLGGRGGRPRGIAFLAAPTGVGKTELAKTVTELLFGDESAYRLKRRLPVQRALVLLAVPEVEWREPPKQAYVATLLDFYSRRITGAVIRGPLTRMVIGRTTSRILDLSGLEADQVRAAAAKPGFLVDLPDFYLANKDDVNDLRRSCACCQGRSSGRGMSWRRRRGSRASTIRYDGSR